MRIPKSAEYRCTHVLIVDNRPFVTIKTYCTDSRAYLVFCLEEGSDHVRMSSHRAHCITARVFDGLTDLGFTLQNLGDLGDVYETVSGYFDQIAAQNDVTQYYKTRI